MNFEQNYMLDTKGSVFLPNENMHFEIHADVAAVYIPGQLTKSENYQILYSRSNSGAEAVIEENRYILNRGDLLVVEPNKLHGILHYGIEQEPYMGYVLTISERYAQRILQFAHKDHLQSFQDCQLIRTRGTIWEQVDNLLIHMLEEQEIKAPGWEYAMLGNALVLLVQIGRAARNDQKNVLKSERQELLTGILSYVESNLGEKITLEDVASRFYVSASTVTHMFTKKMNVSFYKYVMQRRLWMAKNLIKEDMPMERIAVKVGFGDYSSFYRAFKQEFHMSPRQYHREIMGHTENP